MDTIFFFFLTIYNYKTYDYNTEEEDLSDNEYVEDKGSQENVETFSNLTSIPVS